jgi:hypothetical protein
MDGDTRPWRRRHPLFSYSGQHNYSTYPVITFRFFDDDDDDKDLKERRRIITPDLERAARCCWLLVAACYLS